VQPGCVGGVYSKRFKAQFSNFRIAIWDEGSRDYGKEFEHYKCVSELRI
jgi:hypothetical protein